MSAFLAAVLLLAMWGAGVLVYLLPAIVASRRRHPQAGAILVLNLLLGWTLLGWAGAMVWAMVEAAPLGAPPSPVPAPAPTPRGVPDDDDEPPVYEIPPPPKRRR